MLKMLTNELSCGGSAPASDMAHASKRRKLDNGAASPLLGQTENVAPKEPSSAPAPRVNHFETHSYSSSARGSKSPHSTTSYFERGRQFVSKLNATSWLSGTRAKCSPTDAVSADGDQHYPLTPDASDHAFVIGSETGQLVDKAIPIETPMAAFETSPEIVINRCLTQLREDAEITTRSALKKARLSARPNASTTRSDTAAASAVFAALKRSEIKPIEWKMKTNSGLQIKIETKRPKHRIRGEIGYIRTSIEDDFDVPKYAHFVRLQDNVLAPNVTVMNCWPYFGDEYQPVEEDYEACYSMDVLNRPDKLKKLHLSQFLFQQTENMLQALKLTWSDILVSLFAAPPEDSEFPEASSEWNRFIQDLGSAKPLAAQFCEQFQRQTHISVWHLARRSALVKDHFGDANMVDRECRVCFRFDCTAHGELAECETDTELAAGEDSDSEMDEAMATDIVNPPRVNFRKYIKFPGVEPDNPPQLRLDQRKTRHYWESVNFARVNEMEPFYPCHHPGMSCDRAHCSCFVAKIPCEKYCSCSVSCARKFRGCHCSQVRKGLMCFEDDRCACYQTGRECDPDLCGTCGVADVLDPSKADGQCRNANIQRRKPKHTLLGDSTVHELGLFACEKIAHHEFLGEYKGEIITKEEADRRGAIYTNQRLSYLFSLNTKQEVDSTYFGNKVRFINHNDGTGKNVYAHILLVNCVHRIGLFAARDIRPGEELFFDYGPDFPHDQLDIKKRKAPTMRNKALLKNFVAPRTTTEKVKTNESSRDKRPATHEKDVQKPRDNSNKKAKLDSDMFKKVGSASTTSITNEKAGLGRSRLQLVSNVGSKSSPKPVRSSASVIVISDSEDENAAGARLAAYNISDQPENQQLEEDEGEDGEYAWEGSDSGSEEDDQSEYGG